MWHTRLGVRDDEGRVDEKAKFQRVVRAVWARDREALPEWENLLVPPHDQIPFRASLDNGDRHMLVRQSAETWPGQGLSTIPPVPVDADALWLSALGARLDLHGKWTSDPYSLAAIASILRWDHLAPWGRDQYVCVVYPGYLFPFGFRTALVKVTERKMKDAAPSTAGLYQRMFLVPGERIKTYDDRRLPFTEVFIAPEKSPTIEAPTGLEQNTFFWPEIGGNVRFAWTLHALDHERRPVRLHTPLIWVAEHFGDAELVNLAYEGDPDSTVVTHGQKVAFTPVRAGRRHDGPGRAPEVRRRSRRLALPTAAAQRQGRAPRRAVAVGDRSRHHRVRRRVRRRWLRLTGQHRRDLGRAPDSGHARLRPRLGGGQRQVGRLHAAQPPRGRHLPAHRHGR